MNELARRYRLFILSYYVEEETCRFVRCISSAGDSCLVDVTELDCAPPPAAHQIPLTRVQSAPLVDDSSDLAAIHSGADAYETIHLSSGNEKYKRLYEQMRRIGHCFRHLPARVCIERDGLLCQMKPDFSLRWFKARRDAAETWDVVLTPDQLEVLPQLGFIQDRLLEILKDARARRRALIAAFKPQTVVARSRALDDRLEQRTAAARALKDNLARLYQKRQHLEEKRTDLDTRTLRTTDENLVSVETNRALEEVQRLILETVRRIEEYNLEFKGSCLRDEQLLHDAVRALKPLVG